MCGINGFIQFNYKHNNLQMRDMVHSMNDMIIHRGPNSEGLFSDERCALGMRRLSIIDLEGGSQPIWNEDSTKLIVFNGELYNFEKIREQLLKLGHAFKTQSDTEVVLHGYEEYGTDFFCKMEGMYAFCIYDTIKSEWIFARDRIGEKPLYYYGDKDCFAFASELKSFKCIDFIPKEIDKKSLSQYFQLVYIPAPRTIYNNIYKLSPACYLKVSKTGIEEKKYWELDPYSDDVKYEDYDSCKEMLDNFLTNSVRDRMVSDVPIGAFLSGGIDSTIIVGLMSKISDQPINTFTIGFHEKEYDESNLADIVAKKNNTNHRVLYLDWNQAVKDLDYILDNLDEPFADQSLIATYEVSKMTKDYVTVALTGDAGDELFAGYNKYLISYYSNKYNKMPKTIRKYIIEPAVKLLPKRSAIYRKATKVIRNSKYDIFEQRKRMMCLGFKEEEVRELLLQEEVDSLNFIYSQYTQFDKKDEQMRTQYVDLKTVLEGCMLAKVDRASMLASLETRVPMLDSKIIELAFRMPSIFKINNKNRKIILKDTFSDLIPDELYKAPKKGFSVPISKWLEENLKEQLMEYANPDFLKKQGLFNSDYINLLISNHLNHVENRYYELWTFFVFQHWYKNVYLE